MARPPMPGRSRPLFPSFDLDAVRAKTRADMARIPPPCGPFGNPAWIRALGTPLADTQIVPVDAKRAVLVALGDGRTLRIDPNADALVLRTGMVWPARWEAFLAAGHANATCTAGRLPWGRFESAKSPGSAHMRLARRAHPSPMPAHVFVAKSWMGAASFTCPLWTVEIAWRNGGEATATVLDAPRDALARATSSHDFRLDLPLSALGSVTQAAEAAHPVETFLARTAFGLLAQTFLARAFVWARSAPIWLGPTPTGGPA